MHDVKPAGWRLAVGILGLCALAFVGYEVVAVAPIGATGHRHADEGSIRSVGSLLEGIWGDQWPARRAQWLADGLLTEQHLASELDVTSLAPWATVEAKLAETPYGTKLDQWLQRGFGIGPIDGAEWLAHPAINPDAVTLDAAETAEFETLLASLSAEVEAVAADVVIELKLALLQIMGGRDFCFFPITRRHGSDHRSQTKPCHGTYCYRQSLTLDGWAIIIDIDSSVHPRLAELHRVLVASSDRRLGEVKAYLRTIQETDR
jgi:hypothetical protein